MSYFSGEDLIFYKEDDKIKSGGFTINSILLKEGLSPMTTYNQNGGNNISENNNVSSLYDNLAIPAGLLYINHKLNTNCPTINSNSIPSVISDDIHDALFKLIDANTDKEKEKKKKSTKKEKNKIKVNKTKKTKM